MPFTSKNLYSSGVLHLLAVLLLILGASCAPKMQPPPVIEALVITGQNKEGKLKTEPPPPPPEPEPEPDPEPEPEPELPPPPPPPPPEPEPPKPDPEIERKKLEEEKRKREIEIKREAEIQRKKQEEEKKRKEEELKKKEEERKRLEEEKRKKEEERKRLEEERRKKEEERKRKEEEQRRLKEEFERQVREEAEARAEAARIGEVQKTWAQQLSSHIGRRWLRPPSLPDNLRCQVEIRILPNGEVISVTIIKSSGNPSFDHSVENAIYKASPLPLPDDPKAFEPVLRPTFDPRSLGG